MLHTGGILHVTNPSLTTYWGRLEAEAFTCQALALKNGS
ncbi:hypothetical protein APHNP_0805 [Anaplasma phagocytophilum str. ApNP]|uniref:Uncharacterized protein n=2 Tax=Anaplasma phagocytophilum TaxID=948 RepID=A0A0F3NLB6_ANAPH|nr:hypothetical protein APHMUC_1005 [Anaplasma phagocytophilum str. ApMUC09]KJV67679.1 hypothetical protein APHNP_0805 [Anaplasma phagocytophilum str. ApNP]